MEPPPPEKPSNQTVLQSMRPWISRNFTVKDNNVLTHFEHLKNSNKYDDSMIRMNLICCKSFYKSVLQCGI